MEHEVEHKGEGKMRKDTQYYHRSVAVVLGSTPFPVPLGMRFQKDGETDVACAGIPKLLC
jgi:CTP-dependent riboflavin kinase